ARFCLSNGGKDSARAEHVSGPRDRAANCKSARDRQIGRLRQYSAGRRINLSLERKNRDRKRDARLLQAQRRSTIRLSEQTALASSLRSSGNNFCSDLERSPGISALGCRELQLGALTRLAEKINGDADRVRDSSHRDDFYGEAERAWNVDDRINREKNRGQRNERDANRRN